MSSSLFLKPAMQIGSLVAQMFIVVIIGLVYYFFFSYYLMRVFERLDFQVPLLAFVPVVNIYGIVSCARSKNYWVAIIIVLGLFRYTLPLAAIALFYQFYLINKNLDKNPMSSLLILVPIINIFFLKYLGSD